MLMLHAVCDKTQSTSCHQNIHAACINACQNFYAAAYNHKPYAIQMFTLYAVFNNQLPMMSDSSCCMQSTTINPTMSKYLCCMQSTTNQPHDVKIIMLYAVHNKSTPCQNYHVVCSLQQINHMMSKLSCCMQSTTNQPHVKLTAVYSVQKAAA